jgi:quinolinate synthase
MSQITPENLANLLEALVEGRPTNQVTVSTETARWSRVALDRMLAL